MKLSEMNPIERELRLQLANHRRQITAFERGIGAAQKAIEHPHDHSTVRVETARIEQYRGHIASHEADIEKIEAELERMAAQ